MSDYAIIDVETTELRDGEIPRTKFWGFADENGYNRFETSKQLSKFLKQRKEKMTILHHYNFDAIQLLVDGEQIQIRKSHNGRLITSSIHHHTLLNSYSAFPVKLELIFNAFGYEKTSLKNLAKRNYEDCVNGLECFLKLDTLFGKICGVSPLLKHTIAATGFAAAEKVAGEMPKCLDFLDAYRGGRVEVFDLRYYGKSQTAWRGFSKRFQKENGRSFAYDRGKINLSKFDINSSYPFSFLDAPKRAKLLHVGIVTDDWHGPLFDEYELEMLLFPCGKFTSWVFADVWERYIEPHVNPRRFKILDQYKFDFSWLKRVQPFIDSVYKQKNESEGGVKLACKLLLNSTYGRIGLRGDTERARFMDYRPDGDDVIFYKVGKRYLVFDHLTREPRSNFPFAAYITDNARGRLFEQIKKNQAIYCDTDSILTRSGERTFAGKKGDQLGQWKFEGSDSFVAHNVKDYLWGEHEVLKGGREYLNWTLKRFAAGQSCKKVTRSRKTPMRKREVLPNGETNPVNVP